MTPEEINTLIGWLARKNEEARQDGSGRSVNVMASKNEEITIYGDGGDWSAMDMEWPWPEPFNPWWSRYEDL